MKTVDRSSKHMKQIVIYPFDDSPNRAGITVWRDSEPKYGGTVPPAATVTWPSIGEVDPAHAEAFALALTEAVRIARELDGEEASK